MTQGEAEREAVKRERHKSRHMTNKNWQAVHDSVKGWHVALVDCPFHAERVALQTAREALRGGDFGAFREAAADALMAKVRATLASVDRSGEADETRSGSAVGESAVPAQQGDAHPSTPES